MGLQSLILHRESQNRITALSSLVITRPFIHIRSIVSRILALLFPLATHIQIQKLVLDTQNHHPPSTCGEHYNNNFPCNGSVTLHDCACKTPLATHHQPPTTSQKHWNSEDKSREHSVVFGILIGSKLSLPVTPALHSIKQARPVVVPPSYAPGAPVLILCNMRILMLQKTRRCNVISFN